MTTIALLGTVGILLSAQPIAPVRGANALTLPAQRHVLRLQPPDGRAIWLLAVQQDGQEGRGLGLYRSDDEAQSWHFLAPIQNDWTERDTADLVAVGMDVALVYSFEAPALGGSRRHDVYFQWWRYQPRARTWSPEPPVLVFDSTQPAAAFFRAELARDSMGRLWVQAFRLESGGASTAVIAVSTDNGRTFRPQTPLARTNRRGGGRLLSLGTKLIFLYAMHDGFQPTRFRMRDDSAPLDSWGPVTVAFSEGIYHGAALSAAVAPGGGMHLVYKAEDERLYYRSFDGAVFGRRKLLLQRGDWALQSALTLVGNQLYVFYNQPVKLNEAYELVYRIVSDDTVSSPAVLDGSRTFKGYLAAPESLPPNTAHVPCMFGSSTNASVPGQVAVTLAGRSGTPRPPPPSPPPPSGQRLFADAFTRSGASLGSNWREVRGRWHTDGRAVTDLDGVSQASPNHAPCADCRVEAQVIGFGIAPAALYVRAAPEAAWDRYDLLLVPDGKLQLRRYRGTSVTVLAEGPSGIANLDDAARLSLTANGAGPVTLTAAVNGITRLVTTDSSSQALTGPGQAGIWTTRAGVVFDDVSVWSTSNAVEALFVDDFERNGRGLGPDWEPAAALWLTDGRAVSERDESGAVTERRARCGDCQVEAVITTFGASEAGVYLRAPSAAARERYELVLLSNKRIRIRRYRNGQTTVLGEATSGVSTLASPARLALVAEGTSPITLTALVNGEVRLTVTDTSRDALGEPGYAGMCTTRAGVVFDAFKLTPPR